LDGIFSAGMLIAYIAYKDQFAQRASSLVDKWMELRMLRLHCERLSDIVMSRPEDVDGAGIAQSSNVRQDLHVDVSFRYADGEPWVLRHCCLSVREGESVAIVGPSGCGKTTLMKVMLSLLTPTEGQVKVGGRALSQFGAADFRRSIGAVMQDDQLFAGTIADNICFFDTNRNWQRIEQVAVLAAIHDEIVAMPMGYYSFIGDMGSMLSGGQKQRIVLARALYSQPSVLFLDEATSHLDVDKERLINDAIRALDITKIIVAHRPETIQSADRVLRMQNGRIVEAYAPRDSNAVCQAASGSSGSAVAID
jgi:ATP-binding cassette subfamily B protein RaxB